MEPISTLLSPSNEKSNSSTGATFRAFLPRNPRQMAFYAIICGPQSAPHFSAGAGAPHPHVNGNPTCFTNPFGTQSPSTPYFSNHFRYAFTAVPNR